MTEVIVASDPAELVRRATAWLAREIVCWIGERGACAVCLAGGRTPEPVYRALANDPEVMWDRVDVFFTDERAVPPEHPDSNYGMVRRALARAPILGSRVHRIEAEHPDRDAAARDYAASLPERLDVLLLGIGQDGHTASLFPGSPAMDERQRLVVPVIGAKPPAERLTITPPVIERARSVALLATGGDKAEVVARAIESRYDPKAIPAQLARRGTWFLDEAAAGRLTDRRAVR